MLKMIARSFTVGAAALALVLSIGSAAGAAANIALIDTNSESFAGYRHDSVCSAVIGVSREFNKFTYVVEAEGAASADGEVAIPVGTTVRCQIVDVSNGEVFGEVNGGLPGPAAAAVGTVDVPTSATVEARVCGAAVFSDGGSIDTCS